MTRPGRPRVNRGVREAGVTLAPEPPSCYSVVMHCSMSFFFGYFWFSHRPGGGEASA
jgi:hypothetical protein